MKQLHRIIEGILFAADKPLSVDALLHMFDEKERPEKIEVQEALEALVSDYEGRGIALEKLASGYQFQVKNDLAQWVCKLWEERPARYSRALLETLSLIAYRQPITRGEIGEIRGVTVSSQIMKTLLERKWVRVIGHKEVPGKPGLYATTKQFLDDFGLTKLSELPPLSEIKNLEQMGEQLQENLEQDENVS